MMAAKLYRLHVARRKGATSWSDVTYFESFEAFEAKVTMALLDIGAEQARGLKLQVIRRLQRFRGKPVDDPDVTKIVSLRELVDGEWVDRQANLIPPRLEIH